MAAASSLGGFFDFAFVGGAFGWAASPPWGRNVTNAWYWTAMDRVNDTILRYTGMPTTYGVTFSYRFH